MKIEVRVAASPDDLAKVFAVRAAVFMTEQVCPYEEEFDGNDFCSMHMLGLVDGEPACVFRMHFFANFVAGGRLAVLPRFRPTKIHNAVVEKAFEICARKGYRVMYGHAQTRLLKFWERFGFKPTKRDMKLVFSDHEYIEVEAELPLHNDPITMESDPYMIIRPEGKWDEPGPLDRSTARPATNPH